MSFAKWIGAGIGWTFGGPIGAIIGFAAASLFDGVVVNKEFQKSTYSSGHTSRPRTQSGDFEVSLLVLASIVIKSDGKQDQRELDFVRKQFVSMYGRDRSNHAFKLFKEINKQALKHNRIINCLIQVRIAKEETKFGLSYEEVLNILNSDELKTFKNVKITGLMGMATFTKDETIIEKEFSKLNSFFESNQTKYNLETLSMGMSGDYKIGIRNGSTMIRVGSSIFGARNYIA